MRHLRKENVVPGAESAKPRILVVEDNPSTVQVISKMLDRLGHAISAVAVSGEEALRKAAETRPDLVLIDISLQGAMDGADAAVRMRHEINRLISCLFVIRLRAPSGPLPAPIL